MEYSVVKYLNIHSI